MEDAIKKGLLFDCTPVDKMDEETKSNIQGAMKTIKKLAELSMIFEIAEMIKMEDCSFSACINVGGKEVSILLSQTPAGTNEFIGAIGNHMAQSLQRYICAWCKEHNMHHPISADIKPACASLN